MTSDEQKAVDYLKRALLDLNETRRRLKEAESRNSEPIAIVGMGCRYPGGITSPEDLWTLVSEGRHGISELPDDRLWDLDVLRGDPENPGSGYRGGFVNASDFDAGFFGIGDDEALMMDPQHRLFLETTWEACEYGGIDPTALRGSSTGVFLGLSVQTYGSGLLGGVAESTEGYITSGNIGNMASGRVAHTLGLEGPAITIDTACSSSAVALHLACQSLRLGECSMAFTGGVTIIAAPWMFLEFSRQSLFPLSPDGHCRSFADGADGAVFSEGVGVVLLERLSDALRLGHDVLAVISGSAANQDGVSNGLTAPNGLAHERVIRQALSNAGVSAGQIDAVEGHGMGTVLGDPIEAHALIATYGRDRDRPLWLGSVKSNIGHTQASSTVAGVIKMVMAIQHAQLPKTLHVDAPSRHVDWSSGSVSLLVDSVPWTKTGDVRRAAVHALGMSGTNVHIVLEEFPAAPAPSAGRSGDRHAASADMDIVPWILSARDEAGLRRQARRLGEFIAAHPEVSDIADIGYSLVVSRAEMASRAVVLGSDRAQLIEALEDVATARGGPRAQEGVVRAARGDVVLLVGGCQGGWFDVAASLIDVSPVFASEIGRIDEVLSGLLDWSLSDALRGARVEADRVEAPDLIDFAVAVSLVALWRACGVKPSAVVGHGQGELLAVYLAGGLTLSDALSATAARAAHKSHGTLAWRSPEIPCWSASTGKLIDIAGGEGERLPWEEGEPPRLDTVMQSLTEQGYGAFVEVSPTRVRSDALGAGAIVVPAARPERPGLQGVLESLGQLWTMGIGVAWREVFAAGARQRVRLPTYAFDRRRYWPEQSLVWEAGGLLTEQHIRNNDSSPAAISQIGAE